MMEFLRRNQFNTTTSVVPPSGTGTVEYLFDRTTSKFYETAGATGTSVVLSVEFDQATVISHALLKSHNIKAGSIFYDSATANSLASWTGNSDTSNYFQWASTTVSSIQIQMDSPITALSEYKIGDLVVTERLTSFERNPAAKDYKPKRPKTRITHQMPDGGSKVFQVSQKFRADLSWNFITDSFKNELYTVYELADPFEFVPFPTSTAWDGFSKQVNWTNDWDFRHGTNDKTQGFNGKIQIMETPAG